MELKPIKTEKFNSEKFVECLLQEGAKSPCDDSVESFNSQQNLPAFYDEDFFKRGQKFFKDNIFALLYSKFLGLLTILSINNSLQILMYTKKSGCPLTAYRRYLSTLFHMYSWYQGDFAPGSKMWKSLLLVKNQHNGTSKKCFAVGLGRISQLHMAVTQFGFMGFAVIQRKGVGLYNVKDEDLRAFVHVWRVVGHVLGIEDKYNICRESLEETTEICKLLAQKLLKPSVERKDEDFLSMATYLSDGMWSMNPTFNAKIYLNLAYKLLKELDDSEKVCHNSKLLIDLNFAQERLLNFLLFSVTTLRFTLVRIMLNYSQYLALWLMRVCPFLAYYQFGYSNSHVHSLT